MFSLGHSVCSVPYPVKRRENPHRLSKYKHHVNSLNWDGLTFPVSLPQIRQFERNNVGLTIKVYTYKSADDKDTAHSIIPVYITKHTQPAKHIDLLLLQEGEKSHYVWIKKMSRLIAFRTQHKGEAFVCPHCVHPFTSRTAFRRHFPDCSKHERQHLEFPEEKHEKLFWKARAKTQMYPFVIYADFESCLIPVNNE